MPRCLERGRARDGAALRGVIFCATQPEEGRECSGLFEAWRGPGCGGDGVGGGESCCDESESVLQGECEEENSGIV